MSRAKEIKKLRKRLELLESEEVLSDKICEDSVKTCKTLVSGRNKDEKTIPSRNKAKYRIVTVRKGLTVYCNIYSLGTGKILGEGVARCNPKDEFNASLGFDIAQLRAREDWYRKSSEMIIDFISKESI